MKSWAYDRAISALLDIAREATQAAFAIVDEEDHELASQIDQARYEVAKARGILEVEQRARPRAAEQAGKEST